MKSPILIACFSKNSGGMELNAMGIAKLLTQTAPVQIVCRKGSYIETCKEDLKKHGIDLYTINFGGNFSFKCIREVRKILLDKKIKNLIFFGASELKSLYFAIRSLNINFLNFHGTTKTHSKLDPLHKILYKVVNNHLTISQHIKKNVIKIIPGANDNNVKIIYLPYEKTFSGNKSFIKPFHLINTSRITYGKGHEDSLEVFKKLDAEFDAKMTFVGGFEDPVLHKKLEKQISDNNLIGKVIFTGFKKNVAEFYEKAHIMLFPSQGEGLSNSVVEALFHKALPITYSNTVFPEYIQLGFKFPQAEHNDVEGLYKLTREVLKLNEKEFQKIVDDNYQLAQKYFSNAAILSEYNKVLI